MIGMIRIVRSMCIIYILYVKRMVTCGLRFRVGGGVEIPVLTERVYTRSEIGPRASRGRKRIVK